MAKKIDLENQTLADWIKAVSTSATTSPMIEELRTRGYSDHDLNQSVGSLLRFSPNLLLNGLYECMLQIGISPENANEKLAPLYELAQSQTTTDTLAHFIWVGPKSENKKEMLGANTLLESKPHQPIRLWVLDSEVEKYQNEFANKPNVQIVSIENYVKKINISFDRKGEVTLEAQVKKYIASANEKLSRENLSPQDKKDAIRDRVTVVDYIKTLIPIYEGGWVFDSDIIFLENDSQNLQKKEKWAFPCVERPSSESNSKSGIYDIWCFYCNPAMNWNTDKRNGTAFRYKPGQHTDNLYLQMHLLYYHKAVAYVEKKRDSMQPAEIAGYYGSGVRLMIHKNPNNLATAMMNIESSDDSLPRVYEWFQHTNHEIESSFEYPFFKQADTPVDYSNSNQESIFGGFYSVFCASSDTKGLNLVKRMNGTHRIDTPIFPVETTNLFLPTDLSTDIIKSIQKHCKVNELVQPLAGYFRWWFNREGLRPGMHHVNTTGLTAMHLIALLNLMDKFDKFLPLITGNELLGPCKNNVRIEPGLLLLAGIPTDPEKEFTLLTLLNQFKTTPNRLKKSNSAETESNLPLITSIKMVIEKFINEKISLEGFNFVNTDVSGLNFSGMNLNGIIIDDQTNFGDIQTKSIECDHFYYQIRKPQDSKIKIDTKDFLETCEKLQGKDTQKSEGRGKPNFFADTPDELTEKSNGQKLFEILSQKECKPIIEKTMEAIMKKNTTPSQNNEGSLNTM